MKNLNRKIVLFVPIMILCFMCAVGFFITLYRTSDVSYAASKTTMTRKGDTVWFGYYPQTKATADELSKMSTTADEKGFFTSGNDKFVKVTSAAPEHAYHNGDKDYLTFDDGTIPTEGATYYFKLEQIEWKVLVDDADKDIVMLVSKKFLDTHVWLSSYEKSPTRSAWNAYDNTLDGVPAETPANGWRYSEMRAWLNDGFLNFAFSEDEQKSILLFANTHTLDYLRSGKQESAIVNDYIAIGDEANYNLAGNDGRPTDYSIVKGVKWQYNNDNCAYFVNDYATGGYPEYDIRGYISGDHGQVLRVDTPHAVRPILYAKRGDAKILATATQKEEQTKNGLLISGIVFAVVGAGLAIPMMAITSAKYKKLKKETGQEYKLSKLEIGLLVPGLILLIGGCVMIGVNIALNGGFGGLGGTKLEPGIYVQQGQYSGGGIAQVGYTAYRLNSDGTFDYTDSYDHNPVIWSGHGKWSQNGSTVKFVWDGNPMVPAGHTVTVPVKSSTSFGTSGADLFKKQ